MSSGSVRRVSRQDIQLVSCSSGFSFDGTYYRSSTYDCHLYFLCTWIFSTENFIGKKKGVKLLVTVHLSFA